MNPPPFPVADAERWARVAPLYLLRQLRSLTSGIARRGCDCRIFGARQALFRVVANSGSRGDLKRAVAMTAREQEGESAIAMITAELRALRRAVDCVTTRVNINCENIDVLRARCARLATI